MIDVQALEGCKVLDVSTFLAGPFCATQLGEFGADVIKIELPVVGDATRRFGTMTECGDSLPWLSESRNKRCITLDLRKPDGAALLKRLVAESDVMVENFQPGTLEKWGLGYDVLSAVNPRLIMVRISGYGQTGPYKDRPGFGRIGNAFGGLSFPGGLSGSRSGDARIGNDPRLHGRALWRARHSAGIAGPGEDRTRAGRRYRPV